MWQNSTSFPTNFAREEYLWIIDDYESTKVIYVLVRKKFIHKEFLCIYHVFSFSTIEKIRVFLEKVLCYSSKHYKHFHFLFVGNMFVINICLSRVIYMESELPVAEGTRSLIQCSFFNCCDKDLTITFKGMDSHIFFYLKG